MARRRLFSLWLTNTTTVSGVALPRWVTRALSPWVGLLNNQSWHVWTPRWLIDSHIFLQQADHPKGFRQTTSVQSTIYAIIAFLTVHPVRHWPGAPDYLERNELLQSRTHSVFYSKRLLGFGFILGRFGFRFPRTAATYSTFLTAEYRKRDKWH